MIDLRKLSFIAVFLVCFLAVMPGPGDLPGPRNIFIWLEGKIVDAFFVIFGFPLPEHPAVVIAKDQQTVEHLGREPNRSDFAQILENLASAGVEVAAVDFVFSEKKEPAGDEKFAKALENFPAAIVAQRFISGRGFSLNFETL